MNKRERDIRAVVAKYPGMTVLDKRTKKNSYIIAHTSGKVITASSTPKDHDEALRKMEQDIVRLLRQMGEPS
jgi:hypothetical protein